MKGGVEVKRTQPVWKAPEGTFVTGLRVNNSLTRNKVIAAMEMKRNVLIYCFNDKSEIILSLKS